ncbi:MAG: DUF2288 domain-containing protein [Pseudomonadales bacterium]|nr:DUF2288 domain-containing protein [Pseudomonadales bacterium]
MSDQENMTDMHGQTAQLAWSELARFFAAGKVLLIDAELNLVKVAAAISADDTEQVGKWLELQQLSPVNDQQAAEWQQCDQLMWAVVTAPWVLIQIVSC